MFSGTARRWFERGAVASENAEVVPLEDLPPPLGSTARDDSGVVCNRHPLVYLPHVPFTLELPDKRDENWEKAGFSNVIDIVTNSTVLGYHTIKALQAIIRSLALRLIIHSWGENQWESPVHIHRFRL